MSPNDLAVDLWLGSIGLVAAAPAALVVSFVLWDRARWRRFDREAQARYARTQATVERHQRAYAGAERVIEEWRQRVASGEFRTQFDHTGGA